MKIDRSLEHGDALIIVDVQKDFCPGGRLPVEGGDHIVPVLNAWLAAAVSRNVPVYASRDWHPLRHVSFTERGGLWPPHCLQDSDGARFHPDLHLPEQTVLVTKGVRLDQDQNSAFDQTGLASQLREEGIRRVWIGGLAEDVCVLATVLDARREGFEVLLIPSGTCPLTESGGAVARQRMRAAGASVG